ncbi:hypothetical protein Ae201684_005208 [Aphanomyces euteiches]|uniref:Uncharacterized protein n=1 Tax=Aphanomyces euteiches TaxID=100861 RepID=A0A6G0XFG5_9STRA|nr:hypothetical protein Ae201684_005208 [Aphanomyces euteiches]
MASPSRVEALVETIHLRVPTLHVYYKRRRVPVGVVLSMEAPRYREAPWHDCRDMTERRVEAALYAVERSLCVNRSTTSSC